VRKALSNSILSIISTKIIPLISVIFLLAFDIFFYTPGVDAQSGSDWSPPVHLFETTGRASLPEVAADSEGVIHVIWEYGEPGFVDSGAHQSLYYTRLKDGAWSIPVDVLVSPDNRVARVPSMVIDSHGYLHVIWSGGNALLYSSAYAPDAGDARNWATPQMLSSDISIGDPAIAVDDQDRLYAVWSEPNKGLILRTSDDGDLWTEPKTIFAADDGNELARWGRIAVDDGERLHVVLTQTVQEENVREGVRDDPNFLYYLYSDDLGESWSDPFLITPEPDFGEVNVATFGENVVHLIWNGRAGREGRYHLWSNDRGVNWSDIVEVVDPQGPYGGAGLSGIPMMKIDSKGVLHMVSTGSPFDYYTRWQDGTWSVPVNISKNVDGKGISGDETSLEGPGMTLSEGNKLHVVFHDGLERIWYTTTTIDAPRQTPTPLQALSLDTSTNTEGQLPEAMQINKEPVPTVVPFVQFEQEGENLPFSPLLFSIIPLILLLIVLIYAFVVRRGRSYQ
jgi:hypothetical protein